MLGYSNAFDFKFSQMFIKRKGIDCHYARFGHVTNVYLTERSVTYTID